MTKPHWPALVFLAAIFFYARSLGAYFVADDYEFAGTLHLHQASQYFVKGFGGGNEYRPIIPLTYALDQAIGAGSPVPFHITNTILHAANALLLFSIALAVKVSAPRSIFIMTAFLLNPVAHEPLLWISGRPVLLGTLFVLLAIRLFLSNRSIALAGVVVSYLFALGTYEIAVVLPFILGILYCLPEYKSSRRLITLAILLAVSAAYIELWLHLFKFRITRFPVEHSLSAMAFSLVKAFLHSLHGSVRLVPGLLYAAIFLNCLRTPKGRRASFLMIILFIAGYLPFFLVHGFADRFAYLSSTAALIWFTYELNAIPYPRIAALGAVSMLVFFAVGMQNRITIWNQAGEIARAIPQQIKRLAPSLPSGSSLLIENAPAMHKQAYVFISGLPRAVELAYHKSLIVDQTKLRNHYENVFYWDGKQIVQARPNIRP